MNSEEDVDTLIHVLGGIARQLKRESREKNVQQQMDDFSDSCALRQH